MARRAHEASHRFSHPVFRERLECLLAEVESELLGRETLGPASRESAA